MHTPWGASQDSRTYGPGVTFYGTPGHGGFRVTLAVAATMPPALRAVGEDFGGAVWFEEDCAFSAVVLAFPDRFSAPESAGMVGAALGSLRNWYPGAWEAWTGRVLAPGESTVKDELAFHAANRAKWVAICARGDWHASVPAGMVGVNAKIGGRGNPHGLEAAFLVPAAEYETRGPFGFVVDPSRHAPWNEHAPATKEAASV